jgi:hypothetical protein
MITELIGSDTCSAGSITVRGRHFRDQGSTCRAKYAPTEKRFGLFHGCV